MTAGTEGKEEKTSYEKVGRKWYLRDILEENKVVINKFTFWIDSFCLCYINFEEPYLLFISYCFEVANILIYFFFRKVYVGKRTIFIGI